MCFFINNFISFDNLTTILSYQTFRSTFNFQEKTKNLFFLQAEAKKRKILSVKNVDELTDEKIELYTNRMKETILKDRTKAKQ